MSFSFNIDEYRARLMQMSNAELEQYYRQVNANDFPQQWRAITEELARRGIMTLPRDYQAQMKGVKKGSAFPLGLKFGCVGCFGMILVYAAFFAVFATKIPTMMSGMVSDVKTACAGDFAVVTYRTSDMGDMFNGEDKTDKRYAFMIKDGKITDLPAPPASGNLAWDPAGERLVLLDDDGLLYPLYFHSGRPGPKWLDAADYYTGDGDEEGELLFFSYQGENYILHKGKEQFISAKTGDEVEGPLSKGFPLSDSPDSAVQNLDIDRLLVAGDKLYAFWSDTEKGSPKLYFTAFDGAEWSPARVFVKDVSDYDVTSDGTDIYLFYRKTPESLQSGKQQNPLKVMKDMKDVLAMLHVVRFDGKKSHKMESVKISDLEYTPSSDGRNIYIITNGMNKSKEAGAGFGLMMLSGGKWSVIKDSGGEGGFGAFGKEMFTEMIKAALTAIPIILLLVWGCSAMMKKERGETMLIEGQTVKVPTLMRRACALFIDWMLFYPLQYLLMFYFMKESFFGDSMPVPDISDPKLWLTYLIGPVFLVAMFLYFFVLEGFLGGQTLGKKLMRIRVVKDDLTRCTPGAAALRFLLKIADSFFMYLVGAISCAHTDKFQRVGDMAAKTIVVMDEPGIVRKTPPPGLNQYPPYGSGPGGYPPYQQQPPQQQQFSQPPQYQQPYGQRPPYKQPYNPNPPQPPAAPDGTQTPYTQPPPGNSPDDRPGTPPPA